MLISHAVQLSLGRVSMVKRVRYCRGDLSAASHGEAGSNHIKLRIKAGTFHSGKAAPA